MSPVEASRLGAVRGGTRVAVVGVLAAVCVWGFTNTIVTFTPVPALEFAFYRLWVGAAAQLIIVAALRRRLTREMIRLSAPGGALLGAEIVFFFLALKLTDVADVTTISALQPALTLIVAGPLFGEIVTRRVASWTAVSVVGVALVAVGASGTPAWSLRGDVLAAVSLLAWTAYFVVSKRVRATVPALEYMTAVTIVAAIVVTPVLLLSSEPLGSVRAVDWAWLAVFVAGGSGGHLLLAWAHPRVDVTVSSLLMLGLPVVSGFAALVVLGQPVRPLEVAGGAIVIASMATIVRGTVLSGRSGIGAPDLPPAAPV